MRCRDAKIWLGAQRDSDLELSDAMGTALQEHLKTCADCRLFAQQQRHMETLFVTPTPLVRASVSTNQIMQAVQQQKRITQQLEEIQQQQQHRLEHMRPIGTACIALGLILLSSIPLLLLTLVIIQTDLVMKALSVLSGVIDLCTILAQYLQDGLTLLTRNNWLLSAVAFAAVVMMGMWLRLMRPPREA